MLERIFGESRFPHSIAALRRREREEAVGEDERDDGRDEERRDEPQLQLAVLLAMPAPPGQPAELALGVSREAVPAGWRPPDHEESKQ